MYIAEPTKPESDYYIYTYDFQYEDVYIESIYVEDLYLYDLNSETYVLFSGNFWTEAVSISNNLLMSQEDIWKRPKRKEIVI